LGGKERGIYTRRQREEGGGRERERERERRRFVGAREKIIVING
jgi:hypothetical protein